MNHLFEAFLNKEPEIVFEWNDSETDARGWAVINSLRNGAAGGGTRMRKGLTRSEVVSLAKVMEVKFSVSGPPIGGAKSGIDFDPSDPRRREVLERWYRAVFPLLKNYYGTGGDLNVDEIKDVNPITENLGLWHPQEGVVNGHFNFTRGELVNVIGALRFGCSKIIEDPKYNPMPGKRYAIADMVTGWGVSESVRHFYDIFRNDDLKGKKVLIQGWGNVASAAAFYLAESGAKIVGILDRDAGIIRQDGFSPEAIAELFISKNGNKLNVAEARPFEEINKIFWDQEADIFIPGAASKLISKDQIERLIEKGMEVVSCGANVPFTDDEIFFGPTARDVDNRISLIPDFIANSGMARTFAYLMQAKVDISDHAIFGDISETVKDALRIIYSKDQSGHKLSQIALEVALLKLQGTPQLASH